ncbi:MAG: DUF2188 domain-containing protein [Clostridiales bacterium]|nr:DUF2188 domain-containing protein [Clostridiales bacterium]
MSSFDFSELLPEEITDLLIQFLPVLLGALVLLFILAIILIIVLAVKSAKHRNAIRELEEKHKQDLEAASAAKPQSEGEPATDAELTERCNNLSAAVDSLNHEVVEKQQKIDELTAELEQAKSGAPVEGDGAEEIAKLKKENEELTQKCSNLETENKQLENEIKLRTDSAAGNSDRLLNENIELTRENIKLKSDNERLAAENESLKGAASTAQSSSKKTKSAPKADPSVKLVPKVAAAAKPAAKPADDDDVEVDDEFGDESSAIKVKVKYDHNKGNWVITRSDSDRTYRRVATKQEALSLGKDLARRLEAQLVVHKKDGKFQKV